MTTQNTENHLPEEAQTVEAIATLQPNTFSNIAEMLENSTKTKDLKKQVDLIPEYYEFEKAGDKLRCIFLDFVIIQIKDNNGVLQDRKAVRFIADRKIYLNSGYLLVNGVEKSGIVSGTAIEITFDGKDGNTKKYSVSLLG